MATFAISDFGYVPSRRRSGAQAKYESARATDANAALWRNASGLSANAVNDPLTRSRLRNRSRYEEENNGYYSGLINDRANETIGTGPRLQLTLPGDASDPAHEVELKWQEWCNSVGLLDKLLLADKTETRDGEVFLLKFTNPVLPDSGPQLDVQLYEGDQVATPALDPTDAATVDGVEFDSFGNPTRYSILRRHPGGGSGHDLFGAGANRVAVSGEADTYPARRVIHWFQRNRPGQARGVPTLQASLPLYATLRNYTSATLDTARIQSKILGTLSSKWRLPEDDDGSSEDGLVPGQQIPIDQSIWFTLPADTEAKSFPANQPTTGYKEFKNEIITEGGRPAGAPRSVSTGSSAEYNYASGRLDQQQWRRGIKIRRARIARLILNDIFAAWLKEALLIPGYLPAGLPPLDKWRWCWRWDGFVSIDPQKDNDADQTALEAGFATLDQICGERGEDWEEVVEQRAREAEKLRKLGLPVPGEATAAESRGTPPMPAGRPRTPAKEAEEQDDEEPAAEEYGFRDVPNQRLQYA